MNQFMNDRGSLETNSPLYVERAADTELYDALTQGKYCYVLNSRQTGKSSLRVQAMGKLQKNNFTCAVIDLNATPEDITEDDWYYGQLSSLVNDLKVNNLKIDIDIDKWWSEKKGASNLKYRNFLENILLEKIKGNIVIFIDEIDVVLSLNKFSTDAYFGLIRTCHERKSINVNLKRLTFCLLGVASPNNLIKNVKRSPFNIGIPINLKPFDSIEQIEPLTAQIKQYLIAKNREIEYEEISRAILYWSGGHPFLTHQLCDLTCILLFNNQFGFVEELVKNIVANFTYNDILDLAVIQEHFGTIIKRISITEGNIFKILDIYEDVIASKNETIEGNRSSDEIELRLTGLVLQSNNLLKLSNPIYKEKFNFDWIKNERNKLFPFVKEFELWNKEDLQPDDRKKQHQLFLLTDQSILDVALKWREERKGENFRTNSFGKIGEFLTDSQRFLLDAQRYLPRDSNTYEIIQAMNYWTGGLKEFNDRIFEVAKTTEAPETGLERDWVEKLIKSELQNCHRLNVNGCENPESCNYFCKFANLKEIEQIFLDETIPKVQRFKLISQYKNIFDNEYVVFDESPEHRKLQEMCFIIKKDDRMRILNRIYRLIFDGKWIDKILLYIRPYTKVFRDWQHPNCQESSYLLQNNDLKLALEWLGEKPPLEEREIEFVMTSLVAEVWATALPSVQSEAISLIIDFRPSLQGKNNYSDFLLREILQWTKSQISALEKLLGWVNESEIPVAKNREWLESLVRSHLKSCNAQKLSEYLDFDHSYNQRWQELKKYDKNFFSTLDRFISQENINLEAETLKRLKETLDTNPPLSENLNRYGTVTNFHKLVCSFLYEKLSKVNTMIGQKEFDKLLDGIVTNTGGDLESILIFDSEGLALYGNRELKTSNPPLYFALFGDGDEDGDEGGEAIKGFNYLLNIESALSNFGEKTGRGDLSYSIFKLKEGSMMVYFVRIDIPMAICFIAAENINIGNLRRHGVSNIRKIQDAIS
jgi:hypothetical protein